MPLQASLCKALSLCSASAQSCNAQSTGLTCQGQQSQQQQSRQSLLGLTAAPRVLQC